MGMYLYNSVNYILSRCETTVSEHHKMIHVHRKKGQDLIFSQSLMEHISFGMTRYAFRMYV